MVHHQKPGIVTETFSYKFELFGGKNKSQISVKNCELKVEFAVEIICAKTSSNQLETSVGRWQLAARNTVQPTDQRLHGMATARSLSVCPSSQTSWPIAHQTLAAGADYLTCMLMRKANALLSGVQTGDTTVNPGCLS